MKTFKAVGVNFDGSGSFGSAMHDTRMGLELALMKGSRPTKDIIHILELKEYGIILSETWVRRERSDHSFQDAFRKVWG